MLFFFPMWDNQSQHIGKQKCIPLGYTLHCLATQLGSVGLLFLVALCSYIGLRGFSGTFHTSLLWLMAILFAIGIVAQIIFLISWKLAYKKGFEYNYDKREASWIKNGTRVTYNYALDKPDITSE